MSHSATAAVPVGTTIELGGRIPIVVGVAGHRDIYEEDWKSLQQAFKQRLIELLRRYGETPIVLLTALAEGADQLAAEAALDLMAHPAYAERIQIVGPIAMAPRKLEAGFLSGDTAAVQRFRSLRERVLSYPIQAQDGSHRGGKAGDAHEAHRQLAAYLVRNSHVVVAFLSESAVVPDPPDGGTATVVHWAENGLDARYNPGGGPLDPPEALLALRIAVRRRSEPARRAPDVPGWSIEAQIGDRPSGARFHHVFSRFDVFNGDVGRLGTKHAAPIARSAERLISLDGSLATPPDLWPLGDVYASADVLSLDEFKKRTQNHARRLLSMTLIAVVGFESFAHFHLLGHVSQPEWPSLLLYILLLGGAFRLHRSFQKDRIEEKSLVYRSLAEALRLQAAWKYGNVGAIVSSHYARYFRSEVEWVRHAVRGLFACMRPMWARRPEDIKRRRGELLQHWIKGQCSYFSKSRYKFARQVARIRRWWGRCVVAAFALAGLLLVTRALLPEASLSLQTEHVLLGLIVIGMTYAALSHEHTKFRDLEALIRRYGIQLEIFQRAEEELARALDRDRAETAEQILRDLGVEALTENCSWLLLEKDRPLEIIPH